VIVLNDSVDSYPIGVYTDFLRDSKHVLTVDSVASGNASGRFTPSKSFESNFGHTTDVIWIRFTVQNQSTDRVRWLISENYSIIDNVSFYSPAANGKFTELDAGIAHPMDKRAIQNRLVVFPFVLKAPGQKTFYLRFDSQFSLPVYLKIWKPIAFTEKETKKDLVFGLFYGALLIMALYNLFLFFSVKDLSYLYYFLYAASIGYYQSCMDGLSFQFLTPQNVFFNLHMVTSIYVAGIFGMLFVREFLQIQKYSKSLNLLYKILIGMFIGATICLFFISAAIGTFLSAPIWVGELLINILAGIYCLRRGNGNARIYLVATFIYLFGALFRMLRVVGFEQESLLTESALQMGILAEMTILSFALGNRINTIKAEKEREKGLMRNRISTDLHDEIGSNLSTIVVATEMIKRRSMDEYITQRLVEIGQTAMKTADTMRDIVWFINPENDRLDNMILRMKDVAASLLQGVQFDFRSPAIIANNLSPEERRDIFLIYKEVLNNIVKHARATLVEIEVKEDKKLFLLLIRDNGKGFEKESVKMGEGLKNLQRRAKAVGGILNVHSDCGCGTTVEFTLGVSGQEKKLSLVPS